MLSRRDLVGRIAAGMAGAAVLGIGKVGVASIRRDGDIAAGQMPGPKSANANASTTGADAAQTTVRPPSHVATDLPATLSAPAPWELLRPLTMGSMVAHGWRVAGLTGAVDGSCVVTLQNARGRAHRVHICSNEGRPTGLIYTKRFDLVVMNGGQGDLPTEEGFAQAVAEVAHVLAANEHGHRQATVVAQLLPHAERVRRFTGAEDHQLR